MNIYSCIIYIYVHGESGVDFKESAHEVTGIGKEV